MSATRTVHGRGPAPAVDGGEAGAPVAPNDFTAVAPFAGVVARAFRAAGAQPWAEGEAPPDTRGDASSGGVGGCAVAATPRGTSAPFLLSLFAVPPQGALREGNARALEVGVDEPVLMKAQTCGPVVLLLKRCWSGYVLSASNEGREVFSWFTTDLEDALAEFGAVLTTMRTSGLASRPEKWVERP